MNHELPLISCICITAHRPEMLYRAIVSFDQQDYPNKELVISYPEADQITKDLVGRFIDETDIAIIEIERNNSHSIGRARNNAIENCNGDYVCIWDDDDLYFPSRITEQYNSIVRYNHAYEGAVLLHILLYHRFNQSAYVSYPSYWSCTLLCNKKHLITHPCADSDQFECMPVINYLAASNLLLAIDSQPHLYTFMFHGLNLMNYINFLYIINDSHFTSEEVSQNIKIYLD